MIEALPKLKLLITTGMANRCDRRRRPAPERGIVVCGTTSYGNPTTGITFGLMIELTRRIGWENARMKAGEPWQVTLGADIEGQTLGILGLGKLGTRAAGVGKAFGMKVHRVEPEPDAGAMQGGRRRLRLEGRPVPAVGLRHVHLQLANALAGLITARNSA